MIELLIGPITGIIERFIPDKGKAQEMAHEIATMAEKQMHEQMQLQMEVNKQEAAHKSLFVAGWRPFIGWTCGVAMAFNFVLVPILGPIIEAETYIKMEPLDLEVMMPVLLGMLGLGTMRSYEKRNKVARER